MKKSFLILLFLMGYVSLASADEFSEAYEAWDLNRDTMFNGETESLKIKYKEQFQSLEVMGEAPAPTESASHEESNQQPPAPESGYSSEAPKGRFSSGVNLDMSLKESAEEAQKRRSGKK